MGTCRYAIANFEEYDYTVLKSIISVVEVRTESSWEEAREGDADVLFIGMDDPHGELVWERTTEALRVWCSRTDNDEAEHALILPVRPDPLSRLLRALEAEVAAEVAANASGRESATRAAVQRGRGASSGDVFRPADSLLGYVQEIQRGGVRGVLHARSDDPTFPPPNLLVDGAADRFLWAGREPDLASLCALPIDGIRGRKADEREYQRDAVGLEERPITQLLWLAALYGSAGVPTEGLTPRIPIQLASRVANFDIPLAPEEKKLERLLMDKPHSVEQLSAATSLPEKQVMAFINGCIALGIARLEQ